MWQSLSQFQIMAGLKGSKWPVNGSLKCFAETKSVTSGAWQDRSKVTTIRKPIFIIDIYCAEEGIGTQISKSNDKRRLGNSGLANGMILQCITTVKLCDGNIHELVLNQLHHEPDNTVFFRDYISWFESLRRRIPIAAL